MYLAVPPFKKTQTDTDKLNSFPLISRFPNLSQSSGMEILIELQSAETERKTKYPPRNQNVIVTTPNYRRLAHLDSNGVWRWTHGREFIREKIIRWEPL